MWVGRTRRFGIVLSVVIVAALAGGTTVSSGSPDRVCGLGDTAIVEVDRGVSAVSISGEVTERTASQLIVDDGTGTALVYADSNATSGDCITVSGLAQQTSGLDRGVDIVVLADGGRIESRR